MSRPERERNASADDGRVRRTGRWQGVSALALIAGAVGILADSAGLVLVGVVGVVFAGFARAAQPPTVDLSIERSVSDAEPASEQEVTVTVTIENTGDSVLSDLRIIDGVPPALAVESGSPRLATALRPGETTTFSYDVSAARGRHAFEPAFAIARDASGAVERRHEVVATDETPITCVPALDAQVTIGLRQQTIGQPGRVLTDIGGSGVAFHTTREYRPGDPLSRIDWNRKAKTGDLSTVDFREERAAAVERSVAASGALYVALTDAENPVGIAALAPESCWLAPGLGASHRARARELLATHPALAPTPPEEPFFPSIRLRRLRRRLPSEAQLLVCSPLCDDYIVGLLQRLDASGHRVTVLSPDPTSDETPGQRVARTERTLRLSTLRAAGIPVVDWGAESLAVALARAGGTR
ncbi:hypothetical protein C448_14645 [Halococcus morrhuae DSM 1307]|uniref:DUF11 domain-containing protein n=1 Tax=Halococcus morrhuae DSM 1307 TaxID=931277 RepID=M0M4A2_HALMO|nr:DUF58 domain-containing protein [Halococcus morrhuae]EMA39454.1 hypothetical protein C448_14645 [Halococcus morrhuae DSM 1307]